MPYAAFSPPTINPRNASEILRAAINKVFELSAGDLRNFIPGSPLMVLLESLIFAHVEFLHWCEALPSAILIELFAKALGVGISRGTRSSAAVLVTLTTLLSTDFTIPSGAILFAGQDRWRLTADLVIPAGSNTGSALCEAEELGPISASAGAIDQFEASYAYVQSVTNPLAAVLGSEPDDTSSAQEKILSLLTQRNPSSSEDWLNILAEYFPAPLVAKVVPNTPNVVIFIKGLENYTAQAAAFMIEADRQRSLLQQVTLQPYLAVPTELDIIYKSGAPDAVTAASIATELNTFITDFQGEPQLIDLYEKFSAFTNETNLVDFNLRTYDIGTLLVNSELFTGYNPGQIFRNDLGQWFEATASFSPKFSPFDEAELGNLKYYPVLENFALGQSVDKDFIVRVNTQYYLVLEPGGFQVSNAQLLNTPTVWTANTAYTNTSFIKQASPSSAFSHGFIPTASYTSASAFPLASVNPVAKNIGSTVTIGELWFLASRPELLYRASAAATVTALYIESLVPKSVVAYPKYELINHWLINHSKYRIGLLTNDRNYVVVSTDGRTQALPPNLDVTLLQTHETEYGTLYRDNALAEVREFTSATNTARAVRSSGEFDFIGYGDFTPYYLQLSAVSFYESSNLVRTLTLNLGTYS